MGWTATDEEEFPDELPLAAHAHVLPEEHIEGRVEPEGSWIDDVSAMVSPVPTPGGFERTRSAPGHLVDRAVTTLGEVADDPLALLRGLGESSGLSTLLDRFAAHPSGVSRTTGRPYDAVDFGARREATHADEEAARERSPSAYEAGHSAGYLLPLAIPGGAEEEATTAGGSFLRDILSSAAETAPYGAADAAARSEAPDLSGVAADALAGGVASGLAGGALGTIPAGSRALTRQAPALRSRADMARLSSVLGERSAPITSREMQEMTRTLGAGAPRGERVSRAAQRVRDAGVVGPLSTVDDILAAVRERLPAAEARTASIRQAFEDSGARVPVQTLPSALERAASEMERDPALAEHAAAVRRQAERSSDVLMRLMDEGGGTSLSEAERALEPLRTRAGYRSLTEVPSTREAWRDALRSGREAIDEQVSQALGSDAARDFVPARRDVQTLRLLEALSEGRAGRAAMRSPLASTLGPILAGLLTGGASAGAHGAGVGGGVGVAMAAGPLYRAARAREASILASGLETLSDALGLAQRHHIVSPEASSEGGRLTGRLTPELMQELRTRLASPSAPTPAPAPAAEEPDFIPDEGSDDEEPDFIPDEAP